MTTEEQAESQTRTRSQATKSIQRIPVAPAVLKWARQSMGLDEKTAGKRLGVSETTLRGWETGDINPTIGQLRKAAKAYKRPLAVLLLSRPPKDFQPLRDFRQGDSIGLSPALIGELRRSQMQREVFLELLELSPESVQPPVALPAISGDRDAESRASSLRSFLGVVFAEQTRWTNQHDALNNWIRAIEARSILVVHTKGVKVAEAKGFSISQWPFPVIGLNGSDWPRSRVFTLLHELAHLSLNIGGICDLHEIRSERRSADDRAEHECNRLAAAVLLPRNELLAIPSVATATSDTDWTLEGVAKLASAVGVSTEATLLRLITLEKASWDTYWRLKPELDEKYEEARVEQREIQKAREGGPSYYVIKARDIGHAYATSVLEAYHSRAISALDVTDYLGVKYDQLGKLEQVLR